LREKEGQGRGRYGKGGRYHALFRFSGYVHAAKAESVHLAETDLN